MHITILALGSRGDIQPYAVLGNGLKSMGHQVRFITFESFASLIAEMGLDFHPIPGDAQTVVADGGTNMLGLVRSFTSLAKEYARSLSNPHLGEIDLVINQLPGGLYGFDLAEKYNLPMMLASVIPLTRTDTMPLMVSKPASARLQQNDLFPGGSRLYGRCSARSADLGVGPQPIPFIKLTVEKLNQAIQAGTYASEIQQSATDLGKRLE